MSSDLVLAVDLGTSGPKVGLVSTAGAVLDTDFEPVGLQLLPQGGAEQDPQRWWRAVVAATRRITRAHPEAAAKVAAVACTAQWSGTVPVDAAGNPMGNAVIWMDSRGAPAVASLIGGRVRLQGYAPAKLRTWIRLTGGAPGKAGKDSLAHILWLRETDPERYRRTATFLEPKDYLNLRFTGRAVATYDSITLHWVTDNRRPDAVRYHPKLLRLTGLTEDVLPPLIPATEIVGPLLDGVATELGLPAGIPVVAGTPDLHSAAVGSGSVADFVPHLYVGTSSWISAQVPFKKTDLLHNIASLPSPLPGRYFVADEQETAGACLDFVAETLYPDWRGDRSDLYRHLDEVAAAAPPGAGGVVFTPWLTGERTPVEDAAVRSAFFNQSLSTTRGHLVRAVFEGVALNARWLMRQVERFCGRPLGPVTFVGGGARSDVWAKVFADVLGRPVRQAAEPEAVNLRGAALLAGLALGRITLHEVPEAVPIRAIHEPDTGLGDTYDESFRAFTAFYRANRRIHRRLNRR